jgi:hypothetical protein
MNRRGSAQERDNDCEGIFAIRAMRRTANKPGKPENEPLPGASGKEKGSGARVRRHYLLTPLDISALIDHHQRNNGRGVIMAKLEKTGISRDKTEQGLRIAVRLNNRASKRPKELGGLDGLGKRGGTFRLLPLIESVEPKVLDELVERAHQMDPEAKLPDFSSWYQIICPAALNPEKLVNALHRSGVVETAYVMRPVPPPVDASNDPLSSSQGYLNAQPYGVDARYAWLFAGGDGAGIGFVDMEQGWNLQHKDLAAVGIILMSGINHNYFEHGTSVLGEVLMVDNKIGGVGVAPSASGRVVSQWRTPNSSSPNNADAIVSAIASMTFGDVLLLEAQDLDPAGAKSWWPVEVADGTYGAIVLATALGIAVVEAGGNGRHNLDEYTNSSGKRIFDRTSPDFRDSGAIMVAAGSKAYPHTPASTSNHGNRIDCYAWGDQIATTNTNAAGTDDAAYRGDFSGTSGASAIVAGAALIVQGLAQAQLGHRYSPSELRQILKMNGTASANPATDGIGVMPDLRAIITANRLAPTS